VVLLVFLWSNGARLKVFMLDEHFVNVLRLAAVLFIVAGSILAFRLGVWREIIRNFYFRAILALLAAVMLPTLMTGVFRYGQGMVEVIRLPLMYYAYFVFVLLSFITSPRDRVRPLLMALAWTVTGICALYVIAWLYPAANQWFVDQVDIGDRFGSRRLTASAAVNNVAIFCVIYFAVQLFSASLRWRQRVYYSLGLVTLLWYLSFVLVSRARLIGLLACLALLCLRYVNWRKLLAPGIVLLCLLCAMQVATEYKPLDLLAGTYRSIVTLDRESERNTIAIRLEGLHYYWTEFLDSKMIGIGLVSRVRAGSSDVGYAMTQLGYNPSDLGILAVLLFFGIPGLLVTIVVAARIFRDSRLVLRRGTPEQRHIALAIRLYLIFYIVTFYHIFLYEEYALEWGLLFFALARVHAANMPVNTPRSRPRRPVLPFRRRISAQVTPNAQPNA